MEPEAAPATEERPAPPEPTAMPMPTEAPARQVTITWWRLASNETTNAEWQKIADEYMAAHPNVTIESTLLEYEAFKAKLTVVMQSGDPPDIFHSWGGADFHQQAEAGLLKDINADLDANGAAWRRTFGAGVLGAYSYEGRNYGIPWDMSVVSWWYNKELFRQAGIANPPTTWTELLVDVQKLKAAGITPIALAEGDKWPGMMLWSALATRTCGQEGLEAAISRQGSFSDPCFVEAGKRLQELITLKPFQEGYLSAGHGEMQALLGNGQAAMILCGSWTPQFQASESSNGKGLEEDLGLFNFPLVEGGAGNPTDVLGGTNGFVVGAYAEPEAVDFLKYLTGLDNQIALAGNEITLPAVKGADAGLTDPNMILVQQYGASAEYFATYFDQDLPGPASMVLNDSVQGLFAGTLTPEEAARNIEEAVQSAN